MTSDHTLLVEPESGAPEAIESEPQVERAYWVLRAAIANLELRPNEQLSEVTLARRYGFGRTPVREAVHRLRQEGLVVSIPRRGLFVSSFTVDDIREIYELLEGIDGVAAHLVTQRARDDELARLEELHQRMVVDLARGDLATWQEHNYAFHREFVRLAGNQRMTQSFDLLHDQLRRALLLTLPLRGAQNASMEEHAQLLQAICARDAETARSIAQRHRQRVRASVLEKLQSIPLAGLRY